MNLHTHVIFTALLDAEKPQTKRFKTRSPQDNRPRRRWTEHGEVSAWPDGSSAPPHWKRVNTIITHSPGDQGWQIQFKASSVQQKIKLYFLISVIV